MLRQAHGPLLESVAGHWIAKLVIESKAVPASVVRRKLEGQVAEIEAATGRKPGKKEKRGLQDEILLSLLPQAFARQASVWVWFDWSQQRLVLNAGSQALLANMDEPRTLVVQREQLAGRTQRAVASLALYVVRR